MGEFEQSNQPSSKKGVNKSRWRDCPPARSILHLPQEGAYRALLPPSVDAVLLAVHWSRVDDVLKKAGDLSGKPVITCSLPMNDDNTGLVIGHTSSGAEELKKRLPKARVVVAFSTVPSEVLFSVYEAKRKARRPSLVYCGEDQTGKEVAVELIRDARFEPVDAGPLRIARYTEPFALLVGELAYGGTAGPELAYVFERFGKPER